MGKNEDIPGINELAAFIVAIVRDQVAELIASANDAVPDGRTRRFEARMIDEAVLLRVASEQIEEALPTITKAVVDRAREDLTRGLNA